MQIEADVDVTPLIRTGAQVIQSYAGGGFRVSGQIYNSPIIVMPDRTLVWNCLKSPTGSFQESDFDDVVAVAADLDVVLLGCGASMVFLPPALRTALKVRGLHVETMDTGAACRTYNVLMAEGRAVAAALLPAVLL